MEIIRSASGDWLVRLTVALVLAAPRVVVATDTKQDDEERTALGKIVVTATRTATLIADEPLRVEAVPAEEIEENLTVQPGNLSSLLTELPGIRVQSVAPGLTGAKLQLRGMPGRHTLVLTRRIAIAWC